MNAKKRNKDSGPPSPSAVPTEVVCDTNEGGCSLLRGRRCGRARQEAASGGRHRKLAGRPGCARTTHAPRAKPAPPYHTPSPLLIWEAPTRSA